MTDEAGRRPARPRIDLDAVYVETAFARRLRSVLDEARAKHTSHVVAGLSGAGKSTLLDDYRASHPVERRHDGRTYAPVIVGVPTNDRGQSTKGFCNTFLHDLGTVPAGTEHQQTDWLVDQIIACGTELIAADDMHAARPDDLMFLKRVTDLVRSRSGRIVPFVLLCAATPGKMPLQEIINRQTLAWTQFRRRLSPTEPWIHVAGLSPEEVREVLRLYERGVLHEVLPKLRLERWWERIAVHLAHSFFITDRGDRVTMQNVRNVVGGIVDRLEADGLDDIPGNGRLIDEVVARLLASPTTKVLEADPGGTIRSEPTVAAGALG